MSTLVVIPCGKVKIWNSRPDAGPTEAADVYRGAPFIVNRRYAEAFGDEWMILSAKYGFIAPTFVIEGPYEVTFTRPNTKPISLAELRQQVSDLNLARYSDVVGLGGVEYRQILSEAFAPSGVRLRFPFAGLMVGETMAAVNAALAAR